MGEQELGETTLSGDWCKYQTSLSEFSLEKRSDGLPLVFPKIDVSYDSPTSQSSLIAVPPYPWNP